MRTCLLVSIAGMALILCACTDTFLVFKKGHGYFLGSDSTGKYELLCESGDMAKVLEDTHLSRETKDSLYRFNCSTERSGKKIEQIYASMAVEQRKDIRNAFIKNGYEVNHGPECCGH